MVLKRRDWLWGCKVRRGRVMETEAGCEKEGRKRGARRRKSGEGMTGWSVVEISRLWSSGLKLKLYHDDASLFMALQ